MQGFLGHNINPGKVYIFAATKVFNICLQSKSNFKKKFRT